MLLRGRRRVFSACPLARDSGARGVEVAGVKNAAGRRVFQGLQRRLNAAEGALCRRRCEPVARHRNTGKTRSSTCGEASTGVAPRLIWEVMVICYDAYARSKHGRRTAINMRSTGYPPISLFINRERHGIFSKHYILAMRVSYSTRKCCNSCMRPSISPLASSIAVVVWVLMTLSIEQTGMRLSRSSM